MKRLDVLGQSVVHQLDEDPKAVLKVVSFNHLEYSAVIVAFADNS